MNLFKTLMLSLVLFIFFASNTYAYEEQRGYISTSAGNGVNIRSGAGVGFSTVGSGLSENSLVTIVWEEENDIGEIWYKIIYDSSETGYGYVRSDLVIIINISIDSDVQKQYEEELAKFPISYQEKIKALHEIYPNAIFVANNATYSTTDQKTYGTTFMDFNVAVYNEYYTENKSLIYDSGSTRDGYKNLLSYNFDTGLFSNNYPGGGSTWYSANSEIISYYMDPRNFISEKYIFMFESLGYDPDIHTIKGIEDILAGTYMSYTKAIDSNKLYSEIIMEAGISSSVSPYFLASRIVLEVGSTRSGLVLGTYSSYPQFNGYYNYYNIGAGGDSVIYNGLQKAYEEGWSSEEKAIIGGADWIGGSYIAAGQDTTYYQKWDIQCGNKSYCFSTQYMQNIEAPYTESIISYNGYIDSMGGAFYAVPFVFEIPVYDNMEESYDKPSAESPINYLTSLVVNGSLVSNFAYNINEYEVIVDSNATSITISADKKHSGSTVFGTGTIAITDAIQKVNVVVTAANGTTNTYTITVKRLGVTDDYVYLSETLSKLTSLTFNGDYVSGLTNYDTLLAVVIKANSIANLTVINNNGVSISTGDLFTGYKITIEVMGESVTYEFVLYGDTNGDGEINIVDLLRVQKHILGASTLTGSQAIALDVNKDSKVDIIDLLRVQKHILGDTYIVQ